MSPSWLPRRRNFQPLRTMPFPTRCPRFSFLRPRARRIHFGAIYPLCISRHSTRQAVSSRRHDWAKQAHEIAALPHGVKMVGLPGSSRLSSNLSVAGCTGRPNVDWCEDHKEETMRSNLVRTLNLTDCCFQANVHCTVFATGCIYHYDSDHPVGGPAFTEQDEPNFRGSFYSLTKACLETVLKHYANCLILRLRMPVGDDLHPRSFVTKIAAYDRIVDIPNSHSILHELLPTAILLAEHDEVGVYNFTNPGAISQNQVLDLFKEIVRPGLTYRNFSVEEQAKILKAGRSNCELDTTTLVNKLREFGYQVAEIHDAYRVLQEDEGRRRRMRPTMLLNRS